MKNHCYMRLCYMWTGQLLVRSPPLWLAGLLKIPVSIHNPPLLLSNSLSIQGEEELPSSHHPSTSLIGSANYPSREQIRFLGNYIPSNVVHSIIKSFVGVSMGTTDSSRFSNIWRLFFLAGKHLFFTAVQTIFNDREVFVPKQEAHRSWVLLKFSKITIVLFKQSTSFGQREGG